MVSRGARLAGDDPQQFCKTLGIVQQIHVVGNHWRWRLAVGGRDCVRCHTQSHTQTGNLQQLRVRVTVPDPWVIGSLGAVNKALEDIDNLRLRQE